MIYNHLVASHFFEPRNVFDGSDNYKDYIIVNSGTIALGDAIVLYFNCSLETKVISQIKFKVYGNPYLVASVSYWSEKLVGKKIDAVSSLSSQELIDDLEITQTKKYCAYMVEDVFNQAVKQWREEND